MRNTSTGPSICTFDFGDRTFGFVPGFGVGAWTFDRIAGGDLPDEIAAERHDAEPSADVGRITDTGTANLCGVHSLRVC